MNNDILVGHLGWDGCHFLCSCITMSDEIYFNNFTLRGKIEYFFKNISTTNIIDKKPIWNDVYMFSSTSYETEGYVHYRQIWVNDVSTNFEQFEFDSRSYQKSLVSRLHLPIYYPLENMLQKNISHPVAKMFNSNHFICLVNSHLFASLRTIKIENDPSNPDDGDDYSSSGFATLPDIKWFDGTLTEIDKITNSITVSEFQLLSKDIQEKVKLNRNSNLEDLFNSTKLHKCDNDLLKSMVTYEWDCNWFLVEDDTISHIKNLYSEMNLGRCNEKLISKMYKIWIKKMDYLKKWHINDPDKSNYISPVNEDLFLK